MTTATNDSFFKTNVLGHPAGLFVLFFTEMWERFSYYGMRALLVLFLTSSLMDGGWFWPRENALALYGTYTSLVYITPILGGWLADKKIGYRWAVVIGAFIMTLGHASMAVETPTFLYIGISLLIVGNGFFKPNMTSIISLMYEGHEGKKDGAYTIFYMGVNAGAFLGILLCGYMGEQVGWSFGFGLAGIFMFLGMLQFYFAQGIFGEIGLKPKAGSNEKTHEEIAKGNSVAFSPLHKTMMVVMTVAGLFWIFNDAFSKITKNNLLAFGGLDISNYVIVGAVGLFILLVGIRIPQYNNKVRDRLIAVLVFAFFTIFFWASFEQAGGSMSIFARDYTHRVLEGNAANIFRIVNTLVTIVPLGIITYVLLSLFKQTFKNYALSNLFLGFSFVIIWGLALWMLYRQWGQDNPEIPASWFSVLNSLYIITFAPLFSKWWESKYNPSGAFKYAFGLILLGLGFAFLAYGASGIPQGAKTASVSVMWLVLAYLFHTLGELCLSPVALSYISKLVPASMIAFMFGVWYIAIAIGNKTAGSMGGLIDKITAEFSLSTFFLIFTLVPIGIGLLAMLLNPVLKKLMHGVR